MSTSPNLPRLVLRGVDHTARPTWKLQETLHFYRDVLGLPLVHVISARGWGPATHPDFLHFFFDSGNGSTIAFFYYLGEDEPATLQGRAGRAPWPEDHVFDATHTAWLVDSAEELQAWRQRLEQLGLEVSVATTHEVIESVYVRDPNGYFIEFTRKLRPLGEVDATDAELTLRAAVDAEHDARSQGRRVRHIDEVWARKASLLSSAGRAPLRIHVPAVPEFAALVEAARGRPGCRVTPGPTHHLIESEQPLEFGRRELGLKPAVWWGLFTGGVHGSIESYDRDRVRIAPLPA
ncbi:VOC family protein [Ramlibacter sp. AW1]|uniref:VOC family protein n=1 Tax=Ramlibacter aurantiacus TaxID=2801330 RepID=A0A936ZIZ2_9BURK|nr:VOC family protein [Ramlibacter aurantiacus]MBL0420707.1 VOC family protein [Ramlibacter aurantiacus]